MADNILAPIPRDAILSCARGWNGFRLRLCDGRSIIRISLLEIRRRDVARLEQALEAYFGRIFDAEAE